MGNSTFTIFAVLSAILGLSSVEAYTEDPSPVAHYSNEYGEFINYVTSADITTKCTSNYTFTNYVIEPKYHMVRFRLSPSDPNKTGVLQGFATGGLGAASLGVGTNLVVTGIYKGEIVTQFLMNEYNKDYHISGDLELVVTLITKCATPTNYTIQYFTSGNPAKREYYNTKQLGGVSMDYPYNIRYSFAYRGYPDSASSLNVFTPESGAQLISHATLHFSKVDIESNSEGTCPVSSINVYTYLINFGFVKLATVCKLPKADLVFPLGIGMTAFATNAEYHGEHTGYSGVAKPSPAVPTPVVPSQVVPSQVVPSQVVPSQVVPSRVVPTPVA